MTRRQLAAAASLAVTVEGRSAAAQAPAQAAPEDLNAVARAQVRSAAAALDKFKLPMTTEPAFQFKA